MATSVSDFVKQGGAIGSANVSSKAVPQEGKKIKKRGGIGGFIENIARSAAEPFSYMINSAIINPLKEEAAAFTGNKVALRNARRESNRELGMGDDARDIGGGLKKLAGNTAQVGLTLAAPGASTVRGAAAVGAGTGAGSALAQKDSTLSDVLTGGVLGGITGGTLKGAGNIASKVGKGATSGKVAQSLSESGSGLKVGNAVGDIDKLAEQAGFMQKYVGTPKKQLKLMSDDMKVLGKQVDDVLTKTPVKVDGNAVNDRLRNAITDLTDERFIDLDLTSPSVQKIVDRYGAKFAEATDAKAVNDLVKTFNKTATRAQTKLFDPKGGTLTAQEQAALALKRAGDDVLSEIPEIAPLKKQMAQIFEVNPQVARTSERGVSSQLLGGVKLKAPLQAAMGAQSKAGGVLGRLSGSPVVQATPNPMLEKAGGVLGGLTRQGASASAGRSAVPTEEVLPEVPELPYQETDPGFQLLQASQEQEAQDTNPFSPANVEANVQQILAQGGDFKDVAEYMGIVESMQKLTGSTAKPLNATQRKEANNATSALKDIQSMREALSQDASASLKSSLPGGSLTQRLTGTSNYATGRQNVVDAIARLRSGAAITEDEAERFMRLLPGSFDNAEAANQKLTRLEELLYSFTYPEGGTGDDIQSLLSSSY